MTTTTTLAERFDGVQELPIEALVPADDNPRTALGDLDGLVASVQTAGVIEPIVVTANGPHGYTIVAGHRRHAAATAAGLATVPCVHRAFSTTAERQEVMAIENLQREDLSPLDEARAFQMLADLGHSQRTIAERIGVSQPHISRRLKLGRLPDAGRRLLTDGRITIRQAEQLADLPDADIDDVANLVADRTGDGPLQDWVVSDAITKVERRRKHDKAEQTGLASGLKRLTQRPWEGAGTHRPCGKKEATHWYLGDHEATIVWARTAKADAKARAEAGGGADAEPEWQRRQRVLEEEAARRAELLDRLTDDQVATVGTWFILAEFDADRPVTLSPISFTDAEDPLTVIAYAALDAIRDRAPEEPGEKDWNREAALRIRAVWAEVAQLAAPAAETADAGGIAVVPACDEDGAMLAALEIPGRHAAAVKEFVDSTPTATTRQPWPSYDSTDTAGLRAKVAQVNSITKLWHALAYETANRDGAHGRPKVVATIVARLDELVGA